MTSKVSPDEETPVTDLQQGASGAGEGAATKAVAAASKAVGDLQKYNPMSALQVKLRTNHKFKKICACVTLMVVFVDILGTALVMPVLGPLCAYAEGGPVDTIMKMDVPLEVKAATLEEIIHPDAFKDPKPPFKFSLSMNAVMSFGMVGSAMGSLLMGYLCDKIGCKFPMQICVFNGIVGYLLIYAGGKWYNSYYLFAFGMFWNNFFGNTMGVAVVYMRTLFEEGPERDAFAGGVLGMGLVGGSVGALIVMPFVTQPKNGANFFNAVWLALGLTVVMFLVLSFVLVPAPKPTEEEIKKQKEIEKEPTPALAKRILIIAIIASALDSAGDEGTRMARGTIVSAVFPEWSTTERQNYLLLALLVIVILTLILLGVMRKCFNLASIATIGCFFTLGTQLLLMIEWDAAPYIAFWHVGKLFGYLSTLASSFLIQEIAPKNLLGRWNGRNEALTNLAMGIAPLIFAPVYDSIGNPRGQEMLAVTASVSFLATVAYAPLIPMMPKPPKSQKEKEEDALKDYSEYEKMTDLEYSMLPAEEVDKVIMQGIEKGKAPRLVTWGNYPTERPELPGLQERASKDFAYFNQYMITMLTSRDLMIAEQENFKKFQELMPKVDRDKAKSEMGTWIADYFDDAGYAHWETQCTMYKSMLMNAFPPIDPLDDVKPDWATMPLEQWEENATKFLAVLDTHIASSKARAPSKVSADTFLSVLRRR